MTKTTQYKNTAIGPIPTDWEVKKLGELGTVITGNTPSRKDTSLWNGDYCWVTAKDFKNKYIYDTIEKITELGCKKARIVPKGAILITCIASIGNNAIAAVPLATNQQINSIIVLDEYNNEWLYYQLNFFKSKLELLASKTAVPIINKSNFEKIVLPLPPLPEQQKIAEVLSTWDKAIQETDAIIKKLEDRNKALANKLFEENNWQISKLSDLFDRITDKNKEGNTTVTTISAKHGFIRQEDFFNKTVASKDLSNYYLINKGDFCYNKSYSKDYDWGVVKRLNDFEKAVVTTLYICFRFKDNSQNSDFWELYFENKILDKALSKVAQEGGRAHGLLNVTSGDFFGIKVKVPSLEEQNAIAEILNTANQEVKQYQQKLEALKLQKKGLMQQLLTGKVRTV